LRIGREYTKPPRASRGWLDETGIGPVRFTGRR